MSQDAEAHTAQRRQARKASNEELRGQHISAPVQGCVTAAFRPRAGWPFPADDNRVAAIGREQLASKAVLGAATRSDNSLVFREIRSPVSTSLCCAVLLACTSQTGLYMLNPNGQVLCEASSGLCITRKEGATPGVSFEQGH